MKDSKKEVGVIFFNPSKILISSDKAQNFFCKELTLNKNNSIKKIKILI